MSVESLYSLAINKQQEFQASKTTQAKNAHQNVIQQKDNVNKLHSVILDPQSSAFDYSAEALLRQAQELRTKSFHDEFGVTFDNGLDADSYDEACFHVLLMSEDKVVATSRLLNSQRASLVGRFYSDGEFYLQDFLREYPYPILEVGRTCIDTDYRGLRAMMMLWRVISTVAEQVNANAFIGCCSIPIGAGDVNAWIDSLNVPKLDVKPKHRLPLSFLSQDLTTPPLLKMYLKMGASISHQACFDPDFHCADVLVWLPFEHIKAKYHTFLK